MFLTGQASNVLAVGLAAKLADVEVTWAGWLVAALRAGPGLVPRRAVGRAPPGAAGDHPHARGRRVRARASWLCSGPSGATKGITLAVFVGVGLLWLTTGWHRLDVTFVALLGLSVMLVTGHAAVGRRSSPSARPGTCSSGTAAC